MASASRAARTDESTPPGQRQKHPPLGPDLLPELRYGSFTVIPHGPVALGAADFKEEISNHFGTVFGVVHFRMELNAVKAPALVGNGHIGAGVRVGLQSKALRNRRHVVPVAHPGNALFGQPGKELAVGVIVGDGLAVLASGVVLCGGDPSAQGVAH